MKLILDTNVFISAFIIKGECYKFINNIAIDSEIEVYISNEILSELEEKLLNSKRLQKYLKERNPNEIKLFLKFIREYCTILTPTTKINLCRDPEDDMILELANYVKADYIVSGLYFWNKNAGDELAKSDKDLLVLNGESFEDYIFNIVDISGFLEMI